MAKPGSSSPPSNRDKLIDFSKDIPSGSPQFIEEPEVTEAEEKIWKSQVIVPCPNSPPDGNENQEELSAIFPSFEKCSPLIFTEGPYDLSFLNSKFITEPKHENNELYIHWLNMIEGKKGQFWKDIGIFDLIQLSRQGPKYHNEMIIAALHFWNPSTSSLHLKCGTLTPTLLDVVGLIGLKPTGQTFDPDNHDS
jgi:hypothetical protein